VIPVDRILWRRDPRPVLYAIAAGIVGVAVAAGTVVVLIVTRAGAL
jgi:hypothetical protein